MDRPLIGSRVQNYRYFYCASASAVASLLILLIITGYTAYISTEAGKLIYDMNNVMDDLKVVVPGIKDALQLLNTICRHENFTRHFGKHCETPSIPTLLF